MDMTPVNIAIADRQYRIKVSAADEGSVRASVKIINEKITEFKKAFPGKDMQDYISMALIWFATDYKVNSNAAPANNETLIKKMDELEAFIDGHLQQL